MRTRNSGGKRIRALVRLFVGIVCLATVATQVAATREHGGALPAGKFFWEPELSPSGPLVLVISLPDQTLSAYRNGVRIGYSSISSGTRGRRTPSGVFTILEKEVMHFSNKYNHAPMPYMQRLTWQGVAMHGGDLPGYPASHGCIRLPRAFAKKLYSVTTRGTTVMVVDENGPVPTLATRPGIALPATVLSPDFESAEFEWNPDRSAEGPITILVSGEDKTIYVYRNAVAIGRSRFQISDRRKLGGHVFTMLEGAAERPSAIIPDRPGHRWMAVRTETTTSLDELAKRVRISRAFAEKVYDIVSPGTTIVVTDAPALRDSPSAHSVFLMESAAR